MKESKFTSILQLVQMFPDERSCHQYLAAQRWNTGEIMCPHYGCTSTAHYVFKDGIRYKCKVCERNFTAKTNTFMGASKLPTIKWILALYLVMNKKGISSVRLAVNLDVTQKTAWFMLQRIRTAFGNETKENLSGTVEIDETFVGGKNKNRHYAKRMNYKELTSRTYPDKTTVFGMYERETGRVKAMAISRQQFKNLPRLITYNIQPGSTLMTDDWVGYRGIDKAYTRHSIDHKKWVYADGDITTNRVENFWSHLKRGLHGTYISVSPRHLNKYVQEFVFRFNNRTLDVQQQVNNVLQISDVRLKYKDLKAA